MKKIAITTDYICLGQFLKYVGIIGSGAQAKAFLSEEKVLVNGEEEQRRGRKLYDGFVIQIASEKFIVEKENVLS
ncbi:MAG TPA: S4 domain-containing protein YaaA [Bacilli bacterium]|nr:S4 domain-containing protein YaaA [Bacilli bacterium]